MQKAMINKNIDLKYLGAGKYDISITAPDYKKAEELLEKSAQAAVDFMNNNHSQGEFLRKKLNHCSDAQSATITQLTKLVLVVEKQ